jgi:hypothetical protein
MTRFALRLAGGLEGCPLKPKRPTLGVAAGGSRRLRMAADHRTKEET